MKIKIWTNRVDHPRHHWIWNYKITLPNRTVRGAALTYADITERITSFIERDDEARKFVAGARARHEIEHRRKVAEIVAEREAEARRKRRRVLIWGPGRGLTA